MHVCTSIEDELEGAQKLKQNDGIWRTLHLSPYKRRLLNGSFMILMRYRISILLVANVTKLPCAIIDHSLLARWVINLS